MRIYTKGGDKGMTGIFGGERVDKDDIRIEANGALDELNASIGVIRTNIDIKHEWQEILFYIQKSLMIVMSHVATPSGVRVKNKNVIPEDLDLFCEKYIDLYNEELGENSSYFVLPGGTKIGALCHVSRTISRRAERRLWTLNKVDELPSIVLKFINRLSDLFFVMALYDLHINGVEGERWKEFLYKKKE